VDTTGFLVTTSGFLVTTSGLEVTTGLGVTTVGLEVTTSGVLVLGTMVVNRVNIDLVISANAWVAVAIRPAGATLVGGAI